MCIDPRFTGSSAVEKIVLLLNKFYFIISLFWQIWARLGRVVVVRLDKAWQAWLGLERSGRVGHGLAWQAW